METRAHRIPSFLSDRLRSVLIGTALAILAMILALVYVKNYKNDVNAKGDVVPVLVAKHGIEAGTPGSELGRYVTLKHIVRDNLAPGAVSSLSRVRGSFVQQPIYEGDQITMVRFRPLSEQGLKGQIRGVQRIVEISGTKHQLLVGVLKAGDRVDVLASVRLVNSGVPVTRVALRNLKVLTTPQKSDSSRLGSSSSDDSYALLRMTDEQAQKFFYLLQNAEWALVLRPRSAIAHDDAPSIDWAGTVLSGGLDSTSRGTLSQARASGNR